MSFSPLNEATIRLLKLVFYVLIYKLQFSYSSSLGRDTKTWLKTVDVTGSSPLKKVTLLSDAAKIPGGVWGTA
jgi:hypothetical protein